MCVVAKCVGTTAICAHALEADSCDLGDFESSFGIRMAGGVLKAAIHDIKRFGSCEHSFADEALVNRIEG